MHTHNAQKLVRKAHKHTQQQAASIYLTADQSNTHMLTGFGSESFNFAAEFALQNVPCHHGSCNVLSRAILFLKKMLF